MLKKSLKPKFIILVLAFVELLIHIYADANIETELYNFKILWGIKSGSLKIIF